MAIPPSAGKGEEKKHVSESKIRCVPIIPFSIKDLKVRRWDSISRMATDWDHLEKVFI
jgi:hypothetical protein